MLNQRICLFPICSFLMALVFGKQNESNLGYLRCILLLFEAIFGLTENLVKSVLIPIGGEVPDLHVLVRFFGCRIDFLPSSYLSLPLGAPYKCKAIWEPVVKKLQRKLAVWKSKLLFKGGRLTLLQNTLWSIPIYFMSLFTMPASRANQRRS